MNAPYDSERLAADFVGYLKAVQAHAGHEAHAFRLARALELRVRVGLFNRAYPEALPDPVVVVQPWWYGGNNDILRHEIAHVMLYWSGLESHIVAEFGPEAGWRVIENLCQQAVAFLHLPQPLVDEAVRRHGVSAQAVRYLQRVGNAPAPTALRRLMYDDPAAERAGFLTTGHYIAEVAQCNLSLPFRWLDRVPEPAQKFGDGARLTLARLPGRGGTVGVCVGL